MGSIAYARYFSPEIIYTDPIDAKIRETLMSWIERLAERRMLLALAKGQLSGLEGEGKPLPDRTGDAFVSAGEAVAFRLMAEAGVLPEEISLRKAADAQRAVLAGLTDEVERKAAMAKLADIEMRRAMAIEARRRFMKG